MSTPLQEYTKTLVEREEAWIVAVEQIDSQIAWCKGDPTTVGNEAHEKKHALLAQSLGAAQDYAMNKLTEVQHLLALARRMGGAS